MDDLFLSADIGYGRQVCVSPLSRQTYREAGGKGLGGEYGYFIYEMDSLHPQSGIEVIAKAASAHAAMRLFEIITRQFLGSAPASPPVDASV